MYSIWMFLLFGFEAVLILGACFMVSNKKSLWIWTMFLGALIIGVGSFGYIMPAEIPHNDAIIGGGNLFMMLGVDASYFLYPIAMGNSIELAMVAQSQRIIAARFIGFGWLFLASIAAFVVYTLQLPASESGVLGALFRIEKNQTKIISRQDDFSARMAKVEEQQRKDFVRDSLIAIENKRYQTSAAARGEKILKEQRDVKKDLKKSQAKPGKAQPVQLNWYPKLQPTTPKLSPLDPSKVTGKKTSSVEWKRDSIEAAKLTAIHEHNTH